VPKHRSVPSTPYGGKVPADAAIKEGNNSRLLEAFREILDEKLRPLQEILELSRETGGASPDLDPRKEFVAGIIESRPPLPKMTVSVIFSEADNSQNQFPKTAHFRPPPVWKVRFWSDMEGDNRAEAWIAKIRGDPRYLPFESLTPRGKKRSKMNHK
jgi:hypothetical protein